MPRRSKRDVHVRSTDSALAVCGFDWMAEPGTEAVYWTHLNKATCEECLAGVRAALSKLESI